MLLTKPLPDSPSHWDGGLINDNYEITATYETPSQAEGWDSNMLEEDGEWQ